MLLSFFLSRGLIYDKISKNKRAAGKQYKAERSGFLSAGIRYSGEEKGTAA